MNTIFTQILAEGFVFLEGPRWRDGHLWVSDMWYGTVYKIAPDGEREVVVEVPNRPSGIGFLSDGTPLIVSMTDRKILRLANGELHEHADLSNFARADINDMVVGADGSAYVGCFGYDLFAGEAQRDANIMRVDSAGQVSVAADGLKFPNGMIIKDEGKTLVVAETQGHCLTAFTIADDGGLSGRRRYAGLGRVTPDGICLDTRGGIWVASFETDEFVRVLDGGEITDRVDVAGRRAVACQLGSDDGRTLFCLTFSGPLEGVMSGQANAKIETARVAFGAAGSP